MFKGLTGYLYKGSTVVINKNDINSAKDEDFEKVRVLINDKDIRAWATELEMTEEDRDSSDLE